ncbi:STAS domain-containing protein [bacterium]|nr:STAS domain-containing protein [bacterium]
MKYHEEKIGAIQVVRIQEARLDHTVSSELKTELLRLVEAEGEPNLLIDLYEVDYADSSGLGALLFGHRQAKAHSGVLKLVNTNPKVDTLIKIAKLEDILETFADEQAALDSFA